MSASFPRARGGNVARGSRGSTTAPSASTRGTSRGRQASAARGTIRGARGASGQGLLQQMRSGTLARNGQDGGTSAGRGRGANRASTTIRGRGRGSSTKTFNNTANVDSRPRSRSSSPAPFGSSDASAMTGDINQRYTHLKSLRDEERKEAIRQGVLSDPDEKTTLDKAITPVGTCEDMCPLFERVERIRENMIDRCEKVASTDGGRDVPSEEIMVKRFKRSDAGADAQIPSDIRTPKTLLKTLNYLIDKVIGGSERLAVVHKFVWDRTRSIRNDFSIQQVSKNEDVKIAVECFERIARFHIMSLHQLSNPDNLREDENFDVHQEREQLNNTILSLMYYYDDYRDQVNFPNEPEIRAYHMIMAIQPQYPDLEDRIQSWPAHIIADARVQTALRLYQAAGDTLFYQGPILPRAPCPVARNNSGNFFTILNTGAVSYNLACVAEIYFNQVRLVALECLLVSCKSASLAQQQKSRDWSLDVVSEYLAFDTDQQTIDFCAAFSLAFVTDEQGVTYLDIAAYGRSDLDQSALPKNHTFSYNLVEEKRCRRTYQAIINNVSPADAIRQGLVEPADEDDNAEDHDDGESLFIPESNTSFGQQAKLPSFGSGMFNPEASPFAPSSPFGSPTPAGPSTFGSSTVQPETASPFAISKKFGETATVAQPAQAKPLSTSFGQGFGVSQPGQGQTSFTSSFGQSTTSTPFGQGVSSEHNPFGKTSFGLPAATSQVGPGATPAATSAAGASTGLFETQSTPLSASNINSPFGKPITQEQQPATPSLAPEPARVAEPQKPKFPFSGFNFGQSTTTSDQTLTQPPTTSTTAPSAEKSALFSFFPSPQPPPAPQAPAEASKETPQPSFGLPKTTFEFPKAAPPTNPTFSFGKPEQTTPQAQGFNFPAAASTPTNTSPVAAPVAPSSAPEISSSKVPPQDSSNPLFNFTEAIAKTSTPPPPSQNRLPSFQPSTQTSTSLQNLSPSASQQNPSFSRPPPSLAPVSSPTPPIPATKAPPPEKLKLDKERLTEHLVRLALTQPGGLIQEYLEFALPELLQKVVKEYQAEKFRTAVARIKTNYLYRKYGNIWRGVAWRKNLNKRANKRRQNFAESMRMEVEKKKRREDELNKILNAVEEGKRIKAEMQQRQATPCKASPQPKIEQAQLAGSKRKSFDESTSSIPKNEGTPRVIHHKRSRTIGGMQPPTLPPKTPQPAPAQGFRHSIFSGRTSLNRSSSGSNLRQSVLRAKQDDTKTDYFRLLANGIDPDTTLVPLTARQVEARERKDREDRDAAVARAHNRRRIISTAPRDTQSINSAATSPSVASPPPAQAVPSPTPSFPGSVYDPQSDDLLKQLREARQALESDTTWFKEQATKMEKEVEEQEKLRSSTSSHPSPLVLGNGLTVIDGHAYSPAPPQSMSRVEARIRRTGSKLAYLPVGQRSERTSRRSSLRYSSDQQEEEIETNGTAKKRRRRGDVDHSYRPSQDELLDDEEELEISPQKRTKKNVIPPVRSTLPVKASRYNPTSNRFAIPGDVEDQSEEELLEDDGEEDDGEEQYYHHNGQQGVTAQAYEEDDILEDEEESDEDDDEEEEEDLDHEGNYPQGGYAYAGQYQQSAHLYPDLDAGTPNTQATSRATSSAPGATVEDALVLSDSD